MSDQLRALVCRELGNEDGLRVEERRRPAVKPNQVRIQVHAASVNFSDTLMIRGQYQLKPNLPFVPGHEVAGQVLEIGDDVRGFAPGDRVLSLCGIGGFSQEVVITPPTQQLHRIPNGMPWEEAAAFNLSYGTAMHALHQRAALWQGETVLVLGAAGGCGSAAVEIAKAMGATVIGAASGQAKCNFVQDLGADHVIDLESPAELRDEVRAFNGGRGVDVVFDPVGGELFESSLRCLGWGGRFLVVGFAGGSIPSLALNKTILKGISVVGVAYGMAAIRDPARNADDFAWLFDTYQRGAILPRIDTVFPLEKAPDAMRRVRERDSFGKVVIDVMR